MLCTQFYCNTPTHQESVWIHISVVSRSHFVITPSQSKSIFPPLAGRCLHDPALPGRDVGLDNFDVLN
jgi:hypothetical protein